MTPDERLALVADTLAWTQGWDCTDDDGLSGDNWQKIMTAAAEALAHIDKARS